MSFNAFQFGGPPEERSLFIEIEQTGHGGSKRKKKSKTPAQNLNLTSQVLPVSKDRTLLESFTVNNQRMTSSLIESFDLNVHRDILDLKPETRGRLLQALCTVVKDENHTALKAYGAETMTNPTTGRLLRPNSTRYRPGANVVDNDDILYYLQYVKSHYDGEDGPTDTSYFQDTVIDNLKDFVRLVPDCYQSEPTIVGLKNLFEFNRKFGMITSTNYDQVMNNLVVITPTETPGEFSFTTFKDKKETVTHGTHTKIVEVLEDIEQQLRDHQQAMGGVLQYWPFVNINLDLECRLHRPGVSSLDATDTSVSKVMMGQSGRAMAIFQCPTIMSGGFAKQDPRYTLPLGIKMYLLKNRDKLAIFGTAVSGDKLKIDELFEETEKQLGLDLEKLDDVKLFFIDTGVITCEAQYFYGSKKTGLKTRQLSTTGKSPVKGTASIIEELSTSTNPYRITGMSRFTYNTRRDLLPSVWQYLADDCLCGTQSFELLLTARYIADMGFSCYANEVAEIANQLMNMYEGVRIDDRRPSRFDRVSPVDWETLRRVSKIDAKTAGIQYRARVFKSTHYSLADHTIRQILDKYYDHVDDESAALQQEGQDMDINPPHDPEQVEIVEDFLEDHDILEIDVKPDEKFEVEMPCSDFRFKDQPLTGLNLKFTFTNDYTETQKTTFGKRKLDKVEDYPERRFVRNVGEAFLSQLHVDTDVAKQESLVDKVKMTWIEESHEDPQFPKFDLKIDPLQELTEIVDTYRVRNQEEVLEAINTRAMRTIAVAELFASFPTFEIDDLVTNFSHGDEQARTITDPTKFCTYMRKKDNFGYQGATHVCSWVVKLNQDQKLSSETYRVINEYLTNNFSHVTFVSLRKMNKEYIATQIGLYHIPHWYIDKFGSIKSKNTSSERHKKIRHFFRAHEHAPADKLRVQVNLGLVDQGALYLFRQGKYEEDKMLSIKAVVDNNLNREFGSTLEQATLYGHLCDIKNHLHDLGCDITGPDDEEYRGVTEASIKRHYIRDDGFYHRDSHNLPKQRQLSRFEKDQQRGASDSFLLKERKRSRSRSKSRSNLKKKKL